MDATLYELLKKEVRLFADWSEDEEINEGEVLALVIEMRHRCQNWATVRDAFEKVTG